MGRKTILSFLENMNIKVFFLLLFLYKLLFIFQGIDLSDEGFYSTFYNQIYRNPETVQFNFPFWFSGIIGGVVDTVVPGLGILGLRLAGAITIILTCIIAYRILKKILNPAYLKLGLLLCIIFLNNNAKEIQYNNLSALFYVTIAYFVFKGLKENKLISFFFAGFFITLNAFTRLPNILGLGLISAIVYYGYLKRNSLKLQLKQSLAFLSGFSVTAVATIFIMKLIGHFSIYINSLTMLFAMTKEGAEARGKGVSNYSSDRLIEQFFKDYTKSLIYAGVVIILILAGLFFAELFQKTKFYKRWIIVFSRYLISILIFLLATVYLVDNIIILYFLTGLILLAALMIFFSKENTDIKILTFLGCFILIVFPLGSSEGIRMVGPYSLWLALPITINYLFNITSVNTQLEIFGKNPFSLSISASQLQLRQIRMSVLTVFIFICLYYSYYYPFFDRADRVNMHYSLQNKKLKGIYTTRKRANAINELLNESHKYIKPDDYLLAYDCIPLLNYLTDTKPYIRSSYPWLYAPNVFKRELDSAVVKTAQLPVVIAQNIKTIGSGSDWPQTPLKTDKEWEMVNEPRNNYLTYFLKKYNYKQVWTNNIFTIWIPPTMSIQQ